MEFLLQWLDELDDLAAIALHLVDGIRPSFLLPGLVAAALIHADSLGIGFAFVSPLGLAQLALASILLWSTVGTWAYVFNRRVAVNA